LVALDVASSKAGLALIFLIDIPFIFKPISLISIHCYSQATKAKAKSKNFN
jgi:hypothetical protein